MTPQLVVNPATDIDNDELVYWFEVFSDASMTDLVDEYQSVAPTIRVPMPLSDNKRYYWTARAEDAHGLFSEWMEPGIFFVKSYRGWSQDPVIAFIHSAEDLITNSEAITIIWEADDPDGNATVSLYYDNNGYGENGILIAQNLPANPNPGEPGTFIWDVTGPGLEGTWHLYAAIAGENSSMTVYAPGTITIDRTPPVVFAEPPGGAYLEPLVVALTANEPATIYFTTDGSDPTGDSRVYENPMDIAETTTLKVMGMDIAGNQSDILTEEYVIAASDHLPVTVSTDEGMPIAGVKVYGFTESGAYTGKNAVTDDAGIALFARSDFAPGNYKFRVDYMANQFWSSLVPVSAAAVEVIIETEATEVTVTTAAGIAEGVRVYLFSEGGSYLGIYKVTDENGTVVFDLPAGRMFKFRADILGNRYWSDISTIAAGDVNHIAVDAKGGLFEITLLKDPLTPMSGVKIYLFSATGNYLGLSRFTDSSGRVGFDVPEGVYKVRADYLGYQFWSPETFIDVDTAIDLDIAHQDVLITVNCVFNHLHDPLEGIKVYLFTSAGTYLGQNRITGANGDVVFSLPDRPYKVRADYMSRQFWSDEITGSVVAVNIPMADAEITVTGCGLPLEGVQVFGFTASGTYLGINDVTDAAGAVIFRLAAGDYKFRADYQGSQYWSGELTLPADQSVPVEISTGGGTFTLTLMKNATDPLSGAKCYLFSQTGSYLSMSMVSNINGEVSFNLAEGGYKIRVDHLGYKFWTDVFYVPDQPSDVFTILHHDVAVAVEKQYQGTSEPLEGIKVYLFNPAGAYLSQNRTTNAGGGVIFNLPEREYKVRADYLGYQFWSDTILIADAVVGIPHGAAQVHVHKSGSDVQGARVYLFKGGAYLSRYLDTDASGLVEFILPEKIYRFRADKDGQSVFSADQIIWADMVNGIEIDMD